MIVKPNKKGGIDIYCHGQLVLEIGELSDKETINLFLTPIGSNSAIVETDKFYDMPWPYELLAERNKESKKEFLSNEPVFRLTEKGIVTNDKTNIKTT